MKPPLVQDDQVASTHDSQAAVLSVRPARADDPEEVDRIYDICLRTAAHGKDATGMVGDSRLLGDVYVGPYLTYSPDLAWVLVPGQPADAPTLPVGYFLAVTDTAGFERELERSWWPQLRRQGVHRSAPSSGPEAWLRALVADPPRTLACITDPYPAHIHVDLLPEAQGRGAGRRLWTIAVDALRERGVPGVRLGVAARNTRAQGFYEHLGFRLVQDGPETKYFGMRLDPRA